MKHYLFLHIPKAGGSTLRTVLQRQFWNQAVYLIGDDINGDIQRFREMSDDEAARYSLVMGHMQFGLHTQFEKNFCYLSMLREPVARVLSEYHFLKSNQYHSLHAKVREMSLDEYLESGVSDQISNGQTRLLCGTENVSEQGVPTLKEMTENDFNIALANVEQYFPQIGFIERYDQSLVFWQQLFGWRLLLYTRKNVSSESRTNAKVSTAQRNKIIAMNQWDIALYNALIKQFDERVQAAGWFFRIKLTGFKFLNRAYAYYTMMRAR